MFTKYVLPVISLLGLGFAVYTVVKAREVAPSASPLNIPPSQPVGFKGTIAGVGLVEAKRENIPIGVNVPGVVVEVFVKIGDHVKTDSPLFRVDDRDLKAEFRVREAAVVAAKAQLHKLQAAPRPEDVPPVEAAVEEALAHLDDARWAAMRTKNLFDKRIASSSDYDKDRFTEAAAEATYKKAKADLVRIKAGTWKEDLDVAKAAVVQAESLIESIKVGIERLTIRAMAEGEVLQVNVRPGQFAAIAWKEPLIVLGDVNTLHVRVDIDENDLAFFVPDRPAIASLRGRPDIPFKLKYVKTEPYVIPKKSLTGDNSERVDTRVLQVIYAIENAPIKVFVGQQMDAFITLDQDSLKAKQESQATASK